LRWRRDARLLLFQNSVPPDTRILVVAPHPDDAEIAAFGLYGRSNSAIVTLCAGNEGAHMYRRSRGEQLGPADLPAAVRVRESISVPFLAGVHPSRCANLCYADNSLAELYAARNSAVADSSLRLPEAQQLRAMNLASEMFHVSRLPESWAGLIDDLSEIVDSVSPAVIVLPHPLLESHADHCFAAVAAVEAVRQLARSDIRFLFYLVHPRANESHPLGPAGSAASFAPNFGQSLEVSGVYSQWLSAREQSLKHLALEAMSDLRPLRCAGGDWRAALKELAGQLYEATSGCPRNPHDFFRRAVRANELFFVADVAEAGRIVDRFLGQVSEVLKHSRA
jgi:LmbE family N-acetylglucosaminyl deacetylase